MGVARLLAALLLTSCLGSLLGPAVEVQSLEGFYAITSRDSNLVLILPQGELVEDKDRAAQAHGNGSDFYLVSPGEQMTVSGSFQPAAELPELETELAPGTDAQFSRLGDAKLVQYQEAVPGFTRSHAIAHWEKLDTGIELHLTITSHDTAEQNQAKLKGFLRKVLVKTQGRR